MRLTKHNNFLICKQEFTWLISDYALELNYSYSHSLAFYVPSLVPTHPKHLKKLITVLKKKKKGGEEE